jgi:hypothetical protein
MRAEWGLRNADLGQWASGEPVAWDLELTNSTSAQLTRDQEAFHNLGKTQPAVTLLDSFGTRPSIGDPLVRYHSALRIRNTGVWAANENGIHIQGTAKTLLGTPLWSLPWTPMRKSVLGVWARGTAGKELRWKVGMAAADGATVLYLQADGQWSSSETGGLAFGLQPIWHLYTVEFMPILKSGDLTGDAADALLFGVFNSSTASSSADDFVFDIGGFEYDIRGIRSTGA